MTSNLATSVSPYPEAVSISILDELVTLKAASKDYLPQTGVKRTLCLESFSGAEEWSDCWEDGTYLGEGILWKVAFYFGFLRLDFSSWDL